MASSGVAAVLLGFTLCNGAQLVEKDRVLRREMLELSPDGKAIQDGDDKSKGDAKNKTMTVQMEDIFKNDEYAGRSEDQLKEAFCDADFPVGNDDTSTCKETDATSIAKGTDEKLIQSPTMCIFAGKQSGAETEHFNFQIDTSNLGNLRPKGCFKAACTTDSSKTCYFWNNVDPIPSAPVGTPICQRKKLVMATEKVEGTGCPDRYQVIRNEDQCRTAATCMGYAPAVEFRIGIHNASKHLDYVSGCFLAGHNGTHNVVQYNEVPSTMGTPASGQVEGQNLCTVQHTTTW